MSVNCTVRTVGDVTVLDLNGRISLVEELVSGSGALRLQEAVREVVQNGARKVLLNLRHVTYVDSSGLGELVACMTTAQNHEGELRISNATPRILDLLKMTHMNSVLQYHDEESVAVQAFAAKSKTTAA
jgi:anti-sigma B factor antagonist